LLQGLAKPLPQESKNRLEGLGKSGNTIIVTNQVDVPLIYKDKLAPGFENLKQLTAKISGNDVPPSTPIEETEGYIAWENAHAMIEKYKLIARKQRLSDMEISKITKTSETTYLYLEAACGEEDKYCYNRTPTLFFLECKEAYDYKVED
jgi:U3 small nucleolar RNA-associated protein 14